MSIEVFTGSLESVMDFLRAENVWLHARLFTNTLPPGVESLELGDLVEASFPGYAPKVLDDWLVNEFNDDRFGEVLSQPLVWQAGAIEAQYPIGGVYLTLEIDDDPAKLEFIEPFRSPRFLRRQGDQFLYQFSFRVFPDFSLPNVT